MHGVSLSATRSRAPWPPALREEPRHDCGAFLGLRASRESVPPVGLARQGMAPVTAGRAWRFEWASDLQRAVIEPSGGRDRVQGSLAVFG